MSYTVDWDYDNLRITSSDGVRLFFADIRPHVCCGVTSMGQFAGDDRLHLDKGEREDIGDSLADALSELNGQLVTFEFIRYAEEIEDDEGDTVNYISEDTPVAFGWVMDLLIQYCGFKEIHRWINSNTGNEVIQVARVYK